MDCGQYDISREQRKLLEQKAQRRNALRQQYLKEISNPYRHATGEGGTLFDAGVQRFMSMNATGYDHFKPTTKSALAIMCTTIIPVVVLAYVTKKHRDHKEHQYRTSQISYVDRQFKFI